MSFDASALKAASLFSYLLVFLGGLAFSLGLFYLAVVTLAKRIE